MSDAFEGVQSLDAKSTEKDCPDKIRMDQHGSVQSGTLLLESSQDSITSYRGYPVVAFDAAVSQDTVDYGVSRLNPPETLVQVHTSGPEEDKETSEHFGADLPHLTPRSSVAWCKGLALPIEPTSSDALISKFNWK